MILESIALMVILFSQPIFFDVEGEQKVEMWIVDEIVSDRGERANGLAVPGIIMIAEEHFGNVWASMKISQHYPPLAHQGCTTFIHERYHMMYGDWKHESMPRGCEGVW